MNHNKTYIIKIFFVLICITSFMFSYYIFKNMGNNKFNKENADIIVEKILNQYINYEAMLDVKIISNKNENNYKIYQNVNNENSCFEIKDYGLNVTVYDDKFVAKQTNINFEKQLVLDKNSNLINNNLFLNVLINDYNNENNNRKIIKNDLDEIILEIDVNNNTYCSKKILYIDQVTNKPKKLIIKDIQGNEKVIILYNDIRIN